MVMIMPIVVVTPRPVRVQSQVHDRTPPATETFEGVPTEPKSFSPRTGLAQAIFSKLRGAAKSA